MQSGGASRADRHILVRERGIDGIYSKRGSIDAEDVFLSTEGDGEGLIRKKLVWRAWYSRPQRIPVLRGWCENPTYKSFVSLSLPVFSNSPVPGPRREFFGYSSFSHARDGDFCQILRSVNTIFGRGPTNNIDLPPSH